MTAYYNEIDPFCCDVLRARIADGSLPPGVVDQRDVRTVDPSEIAHHEQIHLFAGIGGGAYACRLAGVPGDFRIITAGIPCQPASQAGKRLGRDDERWLWPEFFRLLRGLGSHYALVEQPPGILSLRNGLEWLDILGTLSEIVPDLEVTRISAADVGAPHERDRIWIVCYPALADSDREFGGANRRASDSGWNDAQGGGLVVDDATGGRLHSGSLGGAPCETDQEWERCRDTRDGREPMVDASRGGRRARGSLEVRRADGRRAELGDTGRAGLQSIDDTRSASGERVENETEEQQRERRWGDARDYGELLRPWDDAVAVRGADDTVRFIPREAAEAGPQSPLWPVAHGLPGRVARLRAIGNAWVPQAAVPPLRLILEHDARSRPRRHWHD